ncbi:MAG: hypothetical protein M1816_002724 [Peltula sp. TS41687]|nr:MAG: hypothetical protein M1816_002724 [Peltula sp. TS41687]
MDRLRRLILRQPRRDYAPLNEPNARDGGVEDDESEEEEQTTTAQETASNNDSSDGFSWVVYSVFLILGVAMLWAWNMFLASAAYFQRRFQTDDWLLTNFQSAIISCSTIANLGSVLVLTKLQSKASYPRRIISSLVLNVLCFTLLALSTLVGRDVSPRAYFAFLMAMVFAASLATGLCQNGVFAYVAGFGRPEYTQSIMTGQAIAGVLPCIARQASSKSAFAYFLTATAVSSIALLAFLYLLAQTRSLRPHHHHTQQTKPSPTDDPDQEDPLTPAAEQPTPSIGLLTLFHKLHWLALAVFTCFAMTMVFPVFTQVRPMSMSILSLQRSPKLTSDPHPQPNVKQAILSVHPPHPPTPRLLHPEVFIPLAFLLWNVGDLLGRLATLMPPPRLLSQPRSLFLLALLRVLFIPAYLACNLHGRGASLINSDLLYLFVVQLGFGLSNGWLGSSCMMRAAAHVTRQEREGAGAFMGLMLVAGLTVGSLASFVVARA